MIINAQNASFVVNGDASDNNITDENGNINCNCFQLTPNSPNKVGSVWNNNKIDLSSDNSWVKLYLEIVVEQMALHLLFNKLIVI